jgi:hypothetical protein
MWLSLVDPKNDKPIKLPLHDRRDDGAYEIGRIHFR